jgi:hypothetical protein
MKIAALIVGLIGAILLTGLGAKWVTDFDKNKETIAQLEKLSGALGGAGGEAMAQLERAKTAGYAMIPLGILAIVAAVLVFKMSKPAGAVMIAAAVIPAVLVPSSLIFSFLLILAGIFALVAKPRAATA